MLDAGDNLEQIFTWREPRSVSKSLTVQYDKTLYLLEDNEKSRRVMGKYIEVYHYPDGRIKLWGNNAALPCSAYDRLAEVDQGAIVENKRLGHVLAAAKLVKDKRDDTRSLSVPTTHRTRKKDPAKKPQRALNENDFFEALADLQAHNKAIFGKT